MGAHIQVELDAMKASQHAAGLVGFPVQHVLGGLNLLWAWCWNEGKDVVTSPQLGGIFAVPDHAKLATALVAFGFLEAQEDGAFRVRGAERYLRISTARSEAGKRRAANAIRDEKGRLKPQKEASSSVQHASSKPPAIAGGVTSNSPALTPITDHRSPITDHLQKRSLVVSESETTPTDSQSDRKQQTPSASDQAALPGLAAQPSRAVFFQHLWAELTPKTLPRWREITKSRKTAAKARWSEHPSEGYWRGVMARVAASAFCNGDNPRTWTADLDWLLQPDTAAKVLEGKYDRRAGESGPSGSLKTLTAEQTRGLYG